MSAATGLVRRLERLGWSAALAALGRDGLLDLDDRHGLRAWACGLTTPVEADRTEPRGDHGRTRGDGGRDRDRLQRRGRGGRGGRRGGGLACGVSGDADAGRLNEATSPPETASTAEALPIGLVERDSADESAETGLGAPGARWRPGVGLGTCLTSPNAYEVSCRVRVGGVHPAFGTIGAGHPGVSVVDLPEGFTPRSVLRHPGSGSPAPAKRMCELSRPW